MQAETGANRKTAEERIGADLDDKESQVLEWHE